jgi:hypothetical protein
MERPPDPSARSAAWRPAYTIVTCLAAWAIYLLPSKYGSCRAGGYGQLWCFVSALLDGCMEILAFVVTTVAKDSHGDPAVTRPPS